MDWESVDWTRLERLRAGFLEERARREPYWRDSEDLESYDFTFAERIGWKWDAVLAELSRRGFEPKGQSVLDWGCGSGIASRRFIAHFGGAPRVGLWDHSSLAVDFAGRNFQRAFPKLQVGLAESPSHGDFETVLLSHVLNELSFHTEARLFEILSRAREVIWVEAGTRSVSRRLSAFRDRLLAVGHHVVAPCTHQRSCPLLSSENERHWCHNFTSAPGYVHHDRGWSLFARKMGIDLRRLPYAFLVTTRDPRLIENEGHGLTRILGEPRAQKGLLKLLTCDGQRGVGETILQKRAAPELFKELKDPGHARVYNFKMSGDKIESGEKNS
jgi:SAM-dependent methyltransferase